MGSFNPITLSRNITSLLLFFRIQSTGFVLFTTFQPESSKSVIRIAKKKSREQQRGIFFYLQGETGEQGEAGEKGISGEKVT